MVFIYKKILVALDGSDYDNKAIKKVMAIQRIWNCKVVIFHSIKHFKHPILKNLAVASSMGSYCLTEKELEYKYQEEGEKILKEKKKMFDKAQLLVEIRLIKDEYPAQYMKKIVKEEEFDLVIIGIKGVHSKLNHIYAGSVVHKVLKGVACNFLIVN